ncbi:efflux RND transporter periplasmic adaptor subunit [Ideonella sp.]|uniref:efflux RND transporter periplasmic adaptor subunit n=1 Tax=Ideonella sp. TaxID=1929293 RepID=UPI003BB713F5
MLRRFAAPTLIALSVATLAACSKKEPAPEPVRAVRTMVISDGQSQVGNDYAAEIKARTEARLGFRVGGKLLSRPVNAGDVVRAGQVLAQIDAQDFRLGEAAAQASLSAAQTSLDLAQADLKRYRELRDQGFIGAAELERRETTAKSARAQVEQAQAQLTVQRNQAGYASLVADAAGVITAVDAEPGQVLAAGAPVVRLAVNGPRDAVFSVPEDRAAELRSLIGKTGQLMLQGWGSSTWQPVTVREVAGAADAVTRTFLVKADLGNTTLTLGQTATVRVAGAARSGVIRLPLSAVVELKGQSAVWLLDPAGLTVQQKVIQVAGADGNTVIVAGGLKAGDEVVSAGTHVLTPGQQVRRYLEPKAAASGRPASAASR